MIYLLWSEKPISNDSLNTSIHCYLIAESENELVKKLKKQFPKKSTKISDYIGENNNEIEFRSDLASTEKYILQLPKPSIADKELYVLEYKTNRKNLVPNSLGTSNCNYVYIHFEYSMSKILDKAYHILATASGDNNPVLIEILKRKLNKDGSYNFSTSLDNCTITLYSFDLETEL